MAPRLDHKTVRLPFSMTQILRKRICAERKWCWNDTSMESIRIAWYMVYRMRYTHLNRFINALLTRKYDRKMMKTEEKQNYGQWSLIQLLFYDWKHSEFHLNHLMCTFNAQAHVQVRVNGSNNVIAVFMQFARMRQMLVWWQLPICYHWWMAASP